MLQERLRWSSTWEHSTAETSIFYVIAHGSGRCRAQDDFTSDDEEVMLVEAANNLVSKPAMIPAGIYPQAQPFVISRPHRGWSARCRLRYPEEVAAVWRRPPASRPGSTVSRLRDFSSPGHRSRSDAGAVPDRSGSHADTAC